MNTISVSNHRDIIQGAERIITKQLATNKISSPSPHPSAVSSPSSSYATEIY